MKNMAWVVATLVAVVALTGCQTRKGAAKPAPGDTVATAPATTVGTTADSSATATGLESAGSVGADASVSGLVPAELDGRRVLYFEFDSSEVRAEYQALVAAHAGILAANPSLRVRLEGHTDERGTREYNIGLAERRAQAVRRALSLQGASDSQLSTVSYGEERPAAAGDDDAALAQNRRVELVYGN